MSNKPLHTLKSLCAVFLATVLLASLGVQVASALGPAEYKLNDILFWDERARKCVTTPGSGGPANLNVDKGFSLGTDPKERRSNLITALMKDYPPMTAAQASGVVGNFMHESGGTDLPPDVNEGGRKGPPGFSGGYGWAQWTGGRQKGFIDFAIKNGFMASASEHANDGANYAWLKFEFANAEKTTIPALLASPPNDPEAAAVAFEAAFERAGVPALTQRKAGAKQAFDEYNAGVGTTSPGGGNTTGGGCTTASGGGASIVGDKAFPLKTTKAVMDSKNAGMFKNGTASKGGHPYTAYDILADTGTEVMAFLSGTVTQITEDRCPGRMISIYNKESNLTISYLHMNMDPNTHVGDGDTVAVGQKVGIVGPAAAGCGIAHLHIDAAKGEKRPGCSRLSCPAANAEQFVDIGPDLSKTYDVLP
ncbi:MAG TPA: phage tail tip lysozyme [Candidatus Saccharimonadales bacterium]|nr:phage tail tip lysozyme [Candidatus Saccharimonadales bacterium]